jgi:hypothetical protein
MTEPAEITGEIVRAPPAAEMRYEDADPDAVARVFVRVEYADGRIREYQAKEPRDFKINDPESMSSMVTGRTGLSFPAGGGFSSLTRAVSSLRLSFTAHPRWNLHIRTEAAAPAEFEGITYGAAGRRASRRAVVPQGDAARSTPAEYRDCDIVTDSRREEWKYSEPSDTWCVVDNHMGPGSVSERSARSWQRLQAEYGPLQG